MRLPVGATGQLPIAIGLDALKERVGDAHGVVGVLAGDREIGVAVPIGVVGPEIDPLVALLRELDHSLHIVLRDHRAPRRLDLALQRRVRMRIELPLAQRFRFGRMTSGHDGIEVPARELGAGDERRDFLLLDHLPIDVGLDVGVIDVHRHHLGRAPRCAAGLDGARRAIADLEEAHQAG